MTTEPKPLDELHEWEQDLLREQQERHDREDAERLALLNTVEASEVTWCPGPIRVTVTAQRGRVPLRELLDQVRAMQAATDG